MNTLYYGDNLKILQDRNYFPDACVDLIYLDPTFNSNQRIISAFSNEGDIVLDPFCGCGTTIAAAQKLNRQ